MVGVLQQKSLARWIPMTGTSHAHWCTHPGNMSLALTPPHKKTNTVTSHHPRAAAGHGTAHLEPRTLPVFHARVCHARHCSPPKHQLHTLELPPSPTAPPATRAPHSLLGGASGTLRLPSSLVAVAVAALEGSACAAEPLEEASAPALDAASRALRARNFWPREPPPEDCCGALLGPAGAGATSSEASDFFLRAFVSLPVICALGIDGGSRGEQTPRNAQVHVCAAAMRR